MKVSSTTDGIYHGYFEAMASECEVLVETGDAALAEEITRIAETETLRIQAKYSRYRDDNLVYRINLALPEPVELDDETIRLFAFADQCYRLSDGLFDITSGVLRKAWTFDGSANVPTQQQVDAILPLIGWNRVHFAPPFIALSSGQQIDLGGIGKEYASDQALSRILETTSVPVLVNLGGDLVTNAPPSTGAWTVGVESPASHEVSGIATLRQGALATSGDAKRFLLKDGVRYPHVLDPTTGWPVMTAPRSVSVCAPSCIEAGFLATLAMLMGEQAEEFLNGQDVVHWIQR